MSVESETRLPCSHKVRFLQGLLELLEPALEIAFLYGLETQGFDRSGVHLGRNISRRKTENKKNKNQTGTFLYISLSCLCLKMVRVVSGRLSVYFASLLLPCGLTVKLVHSHLPRPTRPNFIFAHLLPIPLSPFPTPPSSFAEVRGDPCLNGQRARIIVTDELEGPLLVLGEPRPLHLWCGSWCCVQSFLRRDVFDGAKRNKLHRHGGGVELNCFAMQQHRWRSAVHNT